MNKLYPADNDCLSRSRSWRAKLFTGRSRRPTALVAILVAAVTLKVPSTDRTYTSATAGRGEKPAAIMCRKPRRARCVAASRPGANSKHSCGTFPPSTKSAPSKPLASKNRRTFATGFSLARAKGYDTGPPSLIVWRFLPAQSERLGSPSRTMSRDGKGARGLAHSKTLRRGVPR